MPFAIQALLDRYGLRTALLSMAGSLSAMLLAFPFIKPRAPVSQIVGTRRMNTEFLTYSPFWILFMANIMQGLGTFLPGLYMPSTLCYPSSDFSAKWVKLLPRTSRWVVAVLSRYLSLTVRFSLP